MFKQMYLDAVGEARDSPRRNVHQGMWHKHVFNRDTDREIEVNFSLYLCLNSSRFFPAIILPFGFSDFGLVLVFLFFSPLRFLNVLGFWHGCKLHV